jgi:transglutaminase-like putative cysteine protease
MLLEIRHLTQYVYSQPVHESVMELWAQPQKSSRQRLISFDLEVDPAAQLFSYVDAFGNAVHHFDVPQMHGRLAILAKSAVEVQPQAAIPDSLDLGEWQRLRSDFVRGDSFDFLFPHGFCTPTPALEAFSSTYGLDDLRRGDPLTAVRQLNQLIYDAFAYEAGITEVHSPIDKALETGRGVCQDFAHIMIAICRGWGVPARYVSGYVYSERTDGKDRSNPSASHSWVEVFLPSLRWVGFDPTNNVLTDERHVVAAIGRDYSDVPPSRGVYKGDADSELQVGVQVRRAKTAQAEPEFFRPSRPAVSSAGRRGPNSSSLGHQLQQQQQQQQQ